MLIALEGDITAAAITFFQDHALAFRNDTNRINLVVEGSQQACLQLFFPAGMHRKKELIILPPFE